MSAQIVKIKGKRNNSFQVDESQTIDLYPISPLEAKFLSFFKARGEDDSDCKYIVKRLTLPTRLLEEIMIFIDKMSQLSTRGDLTQLYKLVDYAKQENRIYLFQKAINYPRLTPNSRLREINVIHIIKEIVRLYSEFSNHVLKALAQNEGILKGLSIHGLLLDPEEYNLQIDLMMFGFVKAQSILVDPNPEQTNMRNLGDILVQLLFGCSKGKTSLEEIFQKNEENSETGIHLTNVMKNLLRSLFSRNPPTWEKLAKHPLIDANLQTADFETWKNDFKEEENGNEISGSKEQMDRNSEIRNFTEALDTLNDLRVCLLKSPVSENTVRLFLYMVLKLIAMHESFAEDVTKQDCGGEKKKAQFMKQVNLRVIELKNYFSAIMKKDAEDFTANTQTPNEWYSMLNEINFSLDSGNEIDWFSALSKQVQEDFSIVRDWLLKEYPELSSSDEGKAFLSLQERL